MGRGAPGGTSGASGASVARVARRTGAPAVRAHTPPCACTMRVRTRCACTRHTWHAGVHPLHIAVKREYTECIEFLMGRELPLDKVKEELGWACQFDLSQSVYCLLENGVPHGLRRSGPYSLRLYSLRLYSLRLYSLRLHSLRLHSLRLYSLLLCSLSLYRLRLFLRCRRTAWASRALPVEQ